MSKCEHPFPSMAFAKITVDGPWYYAATCMECYQVFKLVKVKAVKKRGHIISYKQAGIK